MMHSILQTKCNVGWVFVVSYYLDLLQAQLVTRIAFAMCWPTAINHILNILFLRSCKQMLRIAALWVITTMSNYLRKPAKTEHKRHLVSTNLGTHAANAELPISFAKKLFLFPAIIDSSTVYFCPKALLAPLYQSDSVVFHFVKYPIRCYRNSYSCSRVFNSVS